MIRLYAYAGVAALGAFLTWWLVAAPRIDIAESKHAEAAAQVVELQQRSADQLDLIRQQQQQFQEKTEIERRNRELLQQVARQSNEQTRTLEELKRNDETLADYLRASVPPSLGSLYERTGTTDPSDYIKPPDLPPDPVLSSPKAETGNK